ncbi:calcium/calmodulin-dependent protein kinase type II subunit alpha-like [Dysidea avara]|uniref:calcium/calmodulin-dependent protein kinase type II subunit alpha-like n=1 Tax=Dysidea avara TaxID=196820 RepID=UPI0033237BEA
MEGKEQKFTDLFELREDLGKGAFSVVKKCIDIRTKNEYAAKIFNTKRLNTRELQKLDREARICRLLKHPSIVRLHHVFKEDVVHVTYMVFDLVTGGELFDDIVAREFYSEKDASYCIQQIVESIAYCHQMSIIHRDIKPENLLLSSKNPGAAVKLADFGLAIEVAKGEKGWYGFAGTPGYLSPEVLEKDPYCHPVDVWGCGVVLYILLAGYPPFWDDVQERMYKQIKAARYDFPSPEWDSVTSEAKQLIRGMLTLDQDARLTAEQVLKHPWIKSREKVASTMHRQETITGLKKFNARRKLKAAMHAVGLVAKKSSFFGSTPRPTSPDSTPKTSTSDLGLPLLSECETDTPEYEIILITNKLLNVIAAADFGEYCKYVADDITCFEPEAGGYRVEGLPFHKFYFNNDSSKNPVNVTFLNPKVRMLGDDAAVITYYRIVQSLNSAGGFTSTSSQETRVWQKLEGNWKCVHFHRSSN